MGNINDLKSFFSRSTGLLLLITLMLLFYFYDFQRIIFLEPQSVHAWRQADCTSFALNYSKPNSSLFSPEINYIGEAGDGKTVSDFPLIYFIVGNIWKITGQHEFIFRGLVLMIFWLSLFFLYRGLKLLFDDGLWAMLIPLMLFTSPVLVYYSNNFLMNIPAFSFVLIGWYFFIRFYKKGESRCLWWSMAFFTLGGLLKLSALLSFVALLGIFILEVLRIFRFRDGRIFSDVRKNMWPFLVSLLVLLAWISFVKYYNSSHNRDFFLVGILPIWEMTSAEIGQKFHEICTHWIFLNFPGYFQALVVVFWMLVLLFRKKIPRVFLFLNIVLAVGAVVFLLLFYQVIAGHDYYWIDLYIMFLLAVVSFVFLLKNSSRRAFQWGKPIFILLLIFNVLYCHKEIDKRYHGASMDYYNQYLKDFSAFKQVKQQFGIQDNDLVVSVPEGTINASLYLMDQKGWSTYGNNFENGQYYESKIERGAKFLLVSDSTLLNADYLQPYIKHPLGHFKSISVFDLRGLTEP